MGRRFVDHQPKGQTNKNKSGDAIQPSAVIGVGEFTRCLSGCKANADEEDDSDHSMNGTQKKDLQPNIAQFDTHKLWQQSEVKHDDLWVQYILSLIHI